MARERTEVLTGGSCRGGGLYLKGRKKKRSKVSSSGSGTVWEGPLLDAKEKLTHTAYEKKRRGRKSSKKKKGPQLTWKKKETGKI